MDTGKAAYEVFRQLCRSLILFTGEMLLPTKMLEQDEETVLWWPHCFIQSEVSQTSLWMPPSTPRPLPPPVPSPSAVVLNLPNAETLNYCSPHGDPQPYYFHCYFITVVLLML